MFLGISKLPDANDATKLNNGSCGITVFNPLLVHEISNQIETSIIESEKIPFYEELFSNAEQYIYQLSYRHSILESVIALELVISKFILQKCSAKGIEGTDAKNYVKNVGLTGSIKVTLRLLLDDIPLPEDTVFEKCKAGITIRNDIVHRGRKDISEIEASDTLKYSRELVNFLLQTT